MYLISFSYHCLQEYTLISIHWNVCNIKSADVLVNSHVPRYNQSPRQLLYVLSCPPKLLFSPMPGLTHKNRIIRHRLQILCPFSDFSSLLKKKKEVKVIPFPRGLVFWANNLCFRDIGKISSDLKKKKVESSTVFAHCFLFVCFYCCWWWFHALNFADNVMTNCPERPASLFSHVLADDEALGFAIGSDKHAEIYTKIDIGII